MIEPVVVSSFAKFANRRQMHSGWQRRDCSLHIRSQNEVDTGFKPGSVLTLFLVKVNGA
jgi:hypothetical protein